MKGSGKGRPLGRALQGLGLALMAGSMAALFGTSLARANPQMFAPFRSIVAEVGAAASAAVSGAVASPASPAPSATPNATPTPHAYLAHRGGPLQLNLNGSLSLGSRASSTTLFNGTDLSVVPSPSASPSQFIGSATTAAESQTLGALGMFAEVSRRTATTNTDFKLPFSLANGTRGQLGMAQLLFSTPHYAIGYGPQTITILGQLPGGSTMRSEYLIVPTYRGDTTLYYGPTIGALSEQLPIYGVRWRELAGRELYEGGLVFANGPISGKSTTAIVGAASSQGNLTLVGESSYQHRSGGDETPAGITYQLRADDGNAQSYLTLIKRHVADGYVSFGSGEIYGDNYTDIAFHRNTSAQSFAFDSSAERVGNLSGLGFSTNRQSSVNYSGPFRFGSYTLGVQSQNTDGSETESQWIGTATSSLSASVGRGFLLLTSQLSRQTIDGPTGSLSQTGYTGAFQQPLVDFNLGISYTAYRQVSDVTGVSTNIARGINLSRQFGRASITLSDAFGRNFALNSDAVTTNAQIGVSRAISPVISIQALYGIQTLRDRLNPASNGRSKTFALQVNAPFTYGNGLVTGRIDPNLPATIAGRVLTDNSGGTGFAGFAGSGVSNVLVVLDDKTIQRTDVTGGFQFSFVSPGQHQLRVETGSLPRGVTVDIPINTIQVQGGQTAQVTFLVGDFGGVNGHVYGRDPNGDVVPLPNVQLRVDGAAYSQTDPTGAYGFGKLRPGKHTISVIQSSVPAFATFDSAKADAVVYVKDGEYTTQDFSAEPLGSIAGTILFGNDMGRDAGTTVSNAYVVAEPGEHAAIVEDDGSFVIDNLPPGDYTVSVDNETIPEGLGALPDTLAVTLGPQEHYQGAAFLVGHGEKKVVFSFLGGNSAAAPEVARVRLSEHRLPPYGTAKVTVDLPQSAGPVKLSGFGDPLDLVYDERRRAWTGQLQVPTGTKAGDYKVTASTATGSQPLATEITVDPKMPIAILQVDPPNSALGQYVRVRARFLVDVKEDDLIEWVDGQTTKLVHPLSGRVFTFSLRVSLRPLHGVLLTRRARLPISLI